MRRGHGEAQPHRVVGRVPARHLGEPRLQHRAQLVAGQGCLGKGVGLGRTVLQIRHVSPPPGAARTAGRPAGPRPGPGRRCARPLGTQPPRGERVEDAGDGQQGHGHVVGQQVLAVAVPRPQTRVQRLRGEGVEGQQPARAQHPGDLPDRRLPPGPVDGVVQDAVADRQRERAVLGRDRVGGALPDGDAGGRIGGGAGAGGVDHALVQVHGEDVEAAFQQRQGVAAAAAAEVEGGTVDRGAGEQVGEVGLDVQGAELRDRLGGVPVGGGAAGGRGRVGHRGVPVSS